MSASITQTNLVAKRPALYFKRDAEMQIHDVEDLNWGEGGAICALKVLVSPSKTQTNLVVTQYKLDP